MTESISMDARLEAKAIDLTEKENELYSEISSEVEEMTKAAQYPVEGWAKNIKNGKDISLLCYLFVVLPVQC